MQPSASDCGQQWALPGLLGTAGVQKSWEGRVGAGAWGLYPELCSHVGNAGTWALDAVSPEDAPDTPKCWGRKDPLQRRRFRVGSAERLCLGPEERISRGIREGVLPGVPEAHFLQLQATGRVRTRGPDWVQLPAPPHRGQVTLGSRQEPLCLCSLTSNMAARPSTRPTRPLGRWSELA